MGVSETHSSEVPIHLPISGFTKTLCIGWEGHLLGGTSPIPLSSEHTEQHQHTAYCLDTRCQDAFILPWRWGGEGKRKLPLAGAPFIIQGAKERAPTDEMLEG